MKNMKKLLTILSTLAVGTTTAVSVVGCKASNSGDSSKESTMINQLINVITEETKKDIFLFKDLQETQDQLAQKFTEFLTQYQDWKPEEDDSTGKFAFNNVEISNIKEQEKQFDVKFTIEFFNNKDDEEADEVKEANFSNVNFYYKEEINARINNFINDYENKIKNDKEYQEVQATWKKDETGIKEKIIAFLTKKIEDIFNEDKYWTVHGYTFTNNGEIKITDNVDKIFTADGKVTIEGPKGSSIKVDKDIKLELKYGTIK